MQVKKSKGFQLICVLLLVSVLLSGCTILQSQKKVQDLEYIARGYGQRETGGYCITVDQCYLSENAVCIKTTLTGLQPGEEVSTAPSCPYIVLKLEQRDEEVVFE